MLDEQIADRLKRAGDTSAGAFNLAADIVHLCAVEAEGWTNRTDDAIQIPEILFDTVGRLQRREDAARPFGG